jgi:NADH dehydrogenase [ubiquinone] 1 alpha subcomplex assembly factor 5
MTKTKRPRPPASGPDPGRPFDRRLLRMRRDRAAAGFDRVSFLLQTAAEQLVDRLADTTRRFDRALVLGAHSGLVTPLLAATGKVGAIISSDASLRMTARGSGMRLVADEEALPFADAAFDLIVSPLVLHWVNDLPGALVQCRRCLRPDGLFLAALLGGDTLAELREATLVAESEVTGGAAPRVAPFAAVRELGGLLQRAGLALSVADSDRLAVRYRDPFALMSEIRAMGGANAPATGPGRPMRRDVLQRTAEVYADRFADPDGRIRATFEIVYLTGWAPHESRPRPLAPGSARTRLADALGTIERTAGDKAGPQRR